MRVALLSDAHLQGPADPNQARLLRFLATLEVDRLCLLGDIFQHWWHFGTAPFPAYAPVIEALRRFPLTFVPGNHDFHAARYFRDVLGAEVAAEVTAEWDGLSVHLSHGDEVDASLGYRALSAVLRGPAFAAVVDRMGPERAWRFLGRVAGHPSGDPDPRLCAAQVATAATRVSAQKTTSAARGQGGRIGPEDGLPRSGRPVAVSPTRVSAQKTTSAERGQGGRTGPEDGLAPRSERPAPPTTTPARAGHTLVVSGHTHAPGVHPVAGGTYVNLGDWVRWHTWLLVDDGRVTLLRRTTEDRDEPFAR